MSHKNSSERMLLHLFARPYLLLILATLLWASNAIVGKLAVGQITPTALVLLRWMGAAGILYAIGATHFHRDLALVRANWPVLLGLGAMGFTGFSVCLYTALHHTSAINVSIEQSAVPMFVLAINFVVLRIRPLAWQIVGFVMGVGGVVLTATRGEPAQLLYASVNRGDLYMIVACIAYAFYSFALRWRPDIHWISFLIAAMIGASVAAAPIFLWTIARTGLVLPSATGWVLLAYVTVFPSIISQAFYARSVELIGANRASLFINLVPVFGALLAVVLLDETLQLYHIAALALVLGGIALAEAQARRLN